MPNLFAIYATLTGMGATVLMMTLLASAARREPGNRLVRRGLRTVSVLGFVSAAGAGLMLLQEQAWLAAAIGGAPAVGALGVLALLLAAHS